jgi:hypothetical protein
VSGGLTIPFEVRNGSGQVIVTVEVLTDPTTVGQVSDAAGFPVCRASVDFSLNGYAGLLGWVQLVGTKTDSQSERAFEIDPLEVFDGLEIPFAFYGLKPSLFDAPYRSDRSRSLDWLAHSFLCVAPTRPMAKEVEAVTGFSWGFIMAGGEVETVPPELLRPADWTGHLNALSTSFPTWTFSDNHTW